MAKCANICSLRTSNGHGDKRQGDLIDRNFQNLDLSRFSLYGFSLSCQIAELFSIHFQCGVHRRNLCIFSDKTKDRLTYLCFRYGCVLLFQDFACHILCIRDDAKVQNGLIGFIFIC